MKAKPKSASDKLSHVALILNTQFFTLCLIIILIVISLVSYSIKDNRTSVIVGKFVTYSNLPQADIRIEDRFGYFEEVNIGAFDKSKLKAGDVIEIEYDSVETNVYKSKRINIRGKSGSIVEPITNKCPNYSATMVGPDRLIISGEVSFVNNVQANIRTPEDHGVYFTGKNNLKKMNLHYGDCLQITYEGAKMVSVEKQIAKNSYPKLIVNFPEWYYLLFTQGNGSLKDSLNSGACVVRGSGNAPTQNLPPLGNGYAKILKPGVNSIDGLIKACSKEDFDLLLNVYCNKNTERAQQGVLTYREDGSVFQSSCGAICDLVACP